VTTPALGSLTTLFSGYTVLCTNPDGSVTEGKQGLFHRDARVLSRHHLSVADAAPELVSAVQPESERWIGVLRVPRPGGTAEGPGLPQDALEVRLERVVGPGMVETIQVRNRSSVPCRTAVRVEIDSDFADVAEASREREQNGAITRRVDADRKWLELDYRVTAGDRTDERGLRLAVVEASSQPTIDEHGISFDLDVAPRGSWSAQIRYAVLDADEWREPTSGRSARRSRQRAAWRRARPTLVCVEPLRGVFERASDDLFDLRNWELEDQVLGSSDGARWVLNAGIPMFTGIFGRDVLTAGWQAAMLGPRALIGGLGAVAASQASQDDPWRDAEPGKLIHEERSGPLAVLGVTPRDAYYGSQTTPAMFVLALSELWHWTGDDAYLRRHIDVARRALEWARRFGDLDGDGFLEYRRRSPRGLRNQGWKDSDEAIRHADGSIVEGPIATVEEQAFYILALERMAEILVALGDDDGAAENLRLARSVRRRWHDAFWMDDLGFYAIALDGAKSPVRSIASNAGHALGAGVVPSEHARAVADRLLSPDMFSGWGVRSLSDRHPSFNPFAYHLGSVWPVEQATFGLGFKRYGLDAHLDRLADALFRAAFASPDGRLPEAIAGQARDEIPAPVPYPNANVPQAWSASALIQMVQIMLGLYPFAPLRFLAVIRPRLPTWLPTLTLERLRVGSAVVDIRFDRRPDGSASWRVIRQRGRLLVVGAGPPDNVGDVRWLERLQLAALDRAPGRLTLAARIALGRATAAKA
jgi:glycogen debranching enzyme